MFGTDSAGSDSAKYYNIVYCTVRYAQAINSQQFINPPSFVEFYPLQKIPSGDFGGKIPRQIEGVTNNTGVQSITISGAQFGVQSFGVDVYNENAYYSQTENLKGIRCCGIALKKIQLNFDANITLSDMRLDVEIGYDHTSEGDNY